ncbi:MAG TPA: CMD domain protein [Reyranella sp.]|jgi:CMD domain protein|nr:CMD domain protein [Reyranella sp.]
MSDVINQLAGIAAGSALDKARDNRPEAKKHAQTSYDSLFSPKTYGNFSGLERAAVAAFVAALHGRPETQEFYKAKLTEAGAPAELQVAVASEAVTAHAHGPYGHYPSGPLTIENHDGLVYSVTVPARHVLGERLATAFEHVHMLVYHPRDARPASLQAMLDAGWSATELVTLSQLVSFLAFQIRVVAGLKALAARPA